MTAIPSVLAFDLGASSGRAIIGRMYEDRLEIEELHRFPNDPVQVGNRLCWDILRLLHEIKQGIWKSVHSSGTIPESIAIDSWAVDFGLLDRHGELLGNPYHYRDAHTQGVMEAVGEQLGTSYLYERTGLQFLPFNTIYQLIALKQADSAQLAAADSLLMIPDLLRYFLTGVKKSEFTNASTTQLLNPQLHGWDDELIKKLLLPSQLFQEIVSPGTRIGVLQSSVCEELHVPPIQVIAVGEHDTASAVAAVPALSPDFAYLSCGTWSLLGTELPEPILTDQACQWNFTNEGGVNGTYRLLKNIMGLWLVQECKREWDKEGSPASYAELTAAAEEAEPFACWVDPDDRRFLNPANMPQEIGSYCRETGQTVPESQGAVIRCILESLALKYRFVLERTEQLSSKTFSGLNMVGGGIHNTLLCQLTANAIGRQVWAGPAEASAIGNVAVQFIALGHLASIEDARRLIHRSFPLVTYEPQQSADWEVAFGDFKKRQL